MGKLVVIWDKCNLYVPLLIIRTFRVPWHAELATIKPRPGSRQGVGNSEAYHQRRCLSQAPRHQCGSKHATQHVRLLSSVPVLSTLNDSCTILMLKRLSARSGLWAWWMVVTDSHTLTRLECLPSCIYRTAILAAAATLNEGLERLHRFELDHNIPSGNSADFGIFPPPGWHCPPREIQLESSVLMWTNRNNRQPLQSQDVCVCHIRSGIYSETGNLANLPETGSSDLTKGA